MAPARPRRPARTSRWRAAATSPPHGRAVSRPRPRRGARPLRRACSTPRSSSSAASGPGLGGACSPVCARWSTAAPAPRPPETCRSFPPRRRPCRGHRRLDHGDSARAVARAGGAPTSATPAIGSGPQQSASCARIRSNASATSSTEAPRRLQAGRRCPGRAAARAGAHPCRRTPRRGSVVQIESWQVVGGRSIRSPSQAGKRGRPSGPGPLHLAASGPRVQHGQCRGRAPHSSSETQRQQR